MKDPEPTPANSGQPQAVPSGAPAQPSPPAPDIPKPPPRKLLITIAIFAVLLICALVLGFIPRWHQRAVATADTSQLQITTVSVVSPAPGSSETSLKLPAEIQPWRQASVYAQTSGYLKDWVVDIGAHVQAGQLMADIETPNLDQQLREAQAQLTLAQANLNLAKITDDRWQNLLKTSSVSIQDATEKTAAHQVAIASVNAAQANVDRLEALVGFQRVLAPFTGVVTLREIDIGDLIVSGNGGKELFHVIQPDKLRVYVRVPEPYANGVFLGEIADLTTPENPGETFTGKVITTSEAISPVSRTLLTELEVDNTNKQILPYSFGEVALKNNNTSPLLTLPASAILFRAQGLQVGVVLSNDTVEVRPVRIGRDFGQTVEILGGVSRSDHVIVNPIDSLVSGIKVRVQSPTETPAEK